MSQDYIAPALYSAKVADLTICELQVEHLQHSYESLLDAHRQLLRDYSSLLQSRSGGESSSNGSRAEIDAADEERTRIILDARNATQGDVELGDRVAHSSQPIGPDMFSLLSQAIEAFACQDQSCQKAKTDVLAFLQDVADFRLRSYLVFPYLEMRVYKDRRITYRDGR